MSYTGKSMSFNSSSVSASTHSIETWLKRDKALELAIFLLNSLKDPEAEEVYFNMFVKEIEEEE